jgi:hypothetical protein
LTNFTLCVNNCWSMRAERLTHWLTDFKPKNKSRIVRDSNPDEQSNAPER